MKIKKLWQNKFFKNYVILGGSLIVLEIIFRLISNLSLFSYASLRVLIGINILAVLFSYILSFLPNIVSKIFNILILLVTSIYGLAELGFKNFIGVYASVQSSTQAKAVMSYFFDYLRSFKWYFYLMLIPLILIIIYYIFFDKKVSVDLPKKKSTAKHKIYRVVEALLIVVLGIMYFSTLKLDFMQNKRQAVSTYELFLKPNNPNLVVSDFGYIAFGLLDIKEAIAPGKELAQTIEYNPDMISKNNENKEEKKAQVTIDNEIWTGIIDKEQDETLNSLNKYFISNSPAYTNKYTGMFENKNVIMIMIESGSNLMINEELYPNMYKIFNEGMNFTNYYSPRNTCSTGNNEMSNMTGLYTIYNNCTANVYEDNTYFESVFNLFKNKGYSTSSFHNYYDRYYNRNKIHLNMGSDRFYDARALNIPYGGSYGDWPSDEELMNVYLQELDKRDTSKPFMNFITTITSHQPYTDDCQYNSMYKDITPENLPDNVRSYMSKLKVVDNAIGILIDGLEKRGLMDDTVLVMFADHYPYGLGPDNMSLALGYDVHNNNEVDHVPFVIYNKNISKQKIDVYTEHVNTTPTIANLFNLSYDSRLYMGHDALSDEYKSLVVFDDGSWKNENGFYDASTNTLEKTNKSDITDEEILEINEDVSLKLKMSSLAIKNDYFSYLNNELNDYNEASTIDTEASVMG